MITVTHNSLDVGTRAQWHELFRRGAIALNCLPSSFIDGNEHVIKQAEKFTAFFLNAEGQAQTSAAVGEYLTCCDHPDCSKCAGRGGIYRVAQLADSTAPSMPAWPERTYTTLTADGGAPEGWKPGEWLEVQTLDEMQAFYMARLPAIRDVAKEHGYAIGLHGTARRDFDLMAMQWRDDASEKNTLAHAIAKAACGITRDGDYQWEKKPSGRFAVSLPICVTNYANPDFDKPSIGHIDLSLIELAAATLPQVQPVLDREEFIQRVTLSIAEMDRDSPEDQPEMMLVTPQELRNTMRGVFASMSESAALAPQVQSEALDATGKDGV